MTASRGGDELRGAAFTPSSTADTRSLRHVFAAEGEEGAPTEWDPTSTFGDSGSPKVFQKREPPQQVRSSDVGSGRWVTSPGFTDALTKLRAMQDALARLAKSHLSMTHRVQLDAMLNHLFYLVSLVSSPDLWKTADSASAFEWQQQLRVYRSKIFGAYHIKLGFLALKSGKEFHSSTVKLPVTPQTGKSWLLLAHHMAMQFGGWLPGSREESVLTDFSTVCSRYAPRLTCTETTSAARISSFFIGVAGIGAWGIVQNVSALAPGLVSTLAVLADRLYTDAGGECVVIGGERRPVMQGSAVFCTGAVASRVQCISSELQARFRTLVLPKPDLRAVAASLLASAGIDAPCCWEIGVKLGTCFELLTGLTNVRCRGGSEAGEYSFDENVLRCIVQRVGVNLRRLAQRNGPRYAQEHLVVKATRDVLLNCMALPRDIPMFSAAISDVFPGRESFVSHGMVPGTIEANASKLGLVATPALITKVTAMYEQQASGRPMLLLGRAFSGKTESWAVFRGLLADVSGEPHDEVRAFPNSYSALEFWGGVLPDASWAEGLFADIIRDVQAKNLKRKEAAPTVWLVLDGALRFGSELHRLAENPVPTFTSLPLQAPTTLPGCVRLVVETTDFTGADPALLSSLAVTHFDAGAVVPPSVILQKRSKAVTASSTKELISELSELCDKHLPEVFAFIEKRVPCRSSFVVNPSYATHCLAASMEALFHKDGVVSPISVVKAFWWVVCWVVAGPLPDRHRAVFYKTVVQPAFTEGSPPAPRTLYDVFYSPQSNEFIPLSNLNKPNHCLAVDKRAAVGLVRFPPLTGATDVLLQALTQQGLNVALCGFAGNGKTSLVDAHMRRMAKNFAVVQFRANASFDQLLEETGNSLVMLDDVNFDAVQPDHPNPFLQMMSQRTARLWFATADAAGCASEEARRLLSRFITLPCFPALEGVRETFDPFTAANLPGVPELSSVLSLLTAKTLCDLTEDASASKAAHPVVNLKSLSDTFSVLSIVSNADAASGPALARLWRDTLITNFSGNASTAEAARISTACSRALQMYAPKFVTALKAETRELAYASEPGCVKFDTAGTFCEALKAVMGTSSMVCPSMVKTAAGISRVVARCGAHALVQGPPGCGKVTTSTAVCRLLGMPYVVGLDDPQGLHEIALQAATGKHCAVVLPQTCLGRNQGWRASLMDLLEGDVSRRHGAENSVEDVKTLREAFVASCHAAANSFWRGFVDDPSLRADWEVVKMTVSLHLHVIACFHDAGELSDQAKAKFSPVFVPDHWEPPDYEHVVRSLDVFSPPSADEFQPVSTEEPLEAPGQPPSEDAGEPSTTASGEADAPTQGGEAERKEPVKKQRTAEDPAAVAARVLEASHLYAARQVRQRCRQSAGQAEGAGWQPSPASVAPARAFAAAECFKSVLADHRLRTNEISELCLAESAALTALSTHLMAATATIPRGHVTNESSARLFQGTYVTEVDHKEHEMRLVCNTTRTPGKLINVGYYIENPDDESAPYFLLQRSSDEIFDEDVVTTQVLDNAHGVEGLRARIVLPQDHENEKTANGDAAPAATSTSSRSMADDQLAVVNGNFLLTPAGHPTCIKASFNLAEVPPGAAEAHLWLRGSITTVPPHSVLPPSFAEVDDADAESLARRVHDAIEAERGRVHHRLAQFSPATVVADAVVAAITLSYAPGIPPDLRTPFYEEVKRLCAANNLTPSRSATRLGMYSVWRGCDELAVVHQLVDDWKGGMSAKITTANLPYGACFTDAAMALARLPHAKMGNSGRMQIPLVFDPCALLSVWLRAHEESLRDAPADVVVAQASDAGIEVILAEAVRRGRTLIVESVTSEAWQDRIASFTTLSLSPTEQTCTCRTFAKPVAYSDRFRLFLIADRALAAAPVSMRTQCVFIDATPSGPAMAELFTEMLVFSGPEGMASEYEKAAAEYKAADQAVQTAEKRVMASIRQKNVAFDKLTDADRPAGDETSALSWFCQNETLGFLHDLNTAAGQGYAKARQKYQACVEAVAAGFKLHAAQASKLGAVYEASLRTSAFIEQPAAKINPAMMIQGVNAVLSATKSSDRSKQGADKLFGQAITLAMRALPAKDRLAFAGHLATDVALLQGEATPAKIQSFVATHRRNTVEKHAAFEDAARAAVETRHANATKLHENTLRAMAKVAEEEAAAAAAAAAEAAGSEAGKGTTGGGKQSAAAKKGNKAGAAVGKKPDAPTPPARDPLPAEVKPDYPWLTAKTWVALLEVAKTEPFVKLPSLVHNEVSTSKKAPAAPKAPREQKWLDWFSTLGPKVPEYEKVPLSKFDRFLLSTAGRPDKFGSCLRKLATETHAALDPFAAVPLIPQDIMASTAPGVPIALVQEGTSCDRECMEAVLGAAAACKATLSNANCIVMQRGSEEGALSAVKQGLITGAWVYLARVQAADELFLSNLSLCVRLAADPHAAFRLFLSYSESPRGTGLKRKLPPAIVADSFVIYVSPTVCVRDSMATLYREIGDDTLATLKTLEWQRLLFTVVWVVIVITQRRRLFGDMSVVLTAAPASRNDATAAVSILNQQLRQLRCADKHRDTKIKPAAWDRLRQTLVDTLSHLDDPEDHAAVAALVDWWVHPEVLKPGFEPMHGGFTVPAEAGDLASHLALIDNMPAADSTELFGLHSSCEAQVQ
eukprot:gene1630-2438_t